MCTVKTPDDEQGNCPKYVEFYSKNKFEKLMGIVGFIISVVYVIQIYGTFTVLKHLCRLQPRSFLLLFRNEGSMAVEYTKVSWILFFFSGCLVGAKYARR